MLGPTFALCRSSSDGRTEGVRAPSSLASLGITDMLTFADCFDTEAEVRGAIGAASQTYGDMAVHAWLQCRAHAHHTTPTAHHTPPNAHPSIVYRYVD